MWLLSAIVLTLNWLFVHAHSQHILTTSTLNSLPHSHMFSNSKLQHHWFPWTRLTQQWFKRNTGKEVPAKWWKWTCNFWLSNERHQLCRTNYLFPEEWCCDNPDMGFLRYITRCSPCITYQPLGLPNIIMTSMTHCTSWLQWLQTNKWGIIQDTYQWQNSVIHSVLHVHFTALPPRQSAKL